jgi:PilZ domain-containing protein
MRCPRCESERIQRDYDDAVVVLRMIGLHKLLCNNCGLVFKGFDPLRTAQRAPSEEKPGRVNRRRGARYNVHLPAAISLIDDKVQVGKVTYSEPSRGHCETISKFGMSLSLVGARFTEGDLSRIGRLFFVRVDLPDGPIEAVVALVTHDRAGEERRKKWSLGVRIHQMSDEDTERLGAYLKSHAEGRHVVITE